MLNNQEVHLIVLLHRKGLSGRDISRISGHARRTIASYLATPESLGRGRAEVTSSTKLDPFKAFLDQRIQTPGWTAKALLREVQGLGYGGSYSLIKRYLRPHRATMRQHEFAWMLGVLQGAVPHADLANQLNDPPDLDALVACLKEAARSARNRVLAVLAQRRGIGRASACAFLHIDRTTYRKYCRLYRDGGVRALLAPQVRGIKKAHQDAVKATVFTILHGPPSVYGINRTTWRMEDLHRVLRESGQPACREVIRTVIREAGYKWRTARRVLTSPDPAYRAKVDALQAILAGLGEDEAFFSVDEYGPFAVLKRGGRKRVAPGETYTVPQWQKSRGSLILTAALELSRNQVTHFYSPRKSTAEMIKMVDILRTQYRTYRTIYVSWDAASWHLSKAFDAHVEARNQEARQRGYPMIQTVPLPVGAQFLNVIESVFSGMARAVIHNSDYSSVDAATTAIDQHFVARNAHFARHPQRAGRKIWGQERAPSAFAEGQNCKDPLYR